MLELFEELLPSPTVAKDYKPGEKVRIHRTVGKNNKTVKRVEVVKVIKAYPHFLLCKVRKWRECFHYDDVERLEANKC